MNLYQSGRNAMYGSMLYVASLLSGMAPPHYTVGSSGSPISIEQKLDYAPPGRVPGGNTRDWGALSPQRVYGRNAIPVDYSSALRNPEGFLTLSPYTPLSALGSGQASIGYASPANRGAAASTMIPHGWSSSGYTGGGEGGAGKGSGSSSSGSSGGSAGGSSGGGK